MSDMWLYAAGMFWGLVGGIFLAWVWAFWRSRSTRSGPSTRSGQTEGATEGDVEEQRTNRHDLARQLDNQMHLAEVWRRALVQRQPAALLAVAAYGNALDCDISKDFSLMESKYRKLLSRTGTGLTGERKKGGQPG